MAEAIPITPTLKGKTAIKFLENMIKEERHPNPKRIARIKEAEKVMAKIKVIY